MQIAAVHYHPRLDPLCLSGFTLIPESGEWLTDSDSLVMFMLWKMNNAWMQSVWVQTRLCGDERDGLRDELGGWAGGQGVLWDAGRRGGHKVHRPGLLRNPSSVCSAGIQWNLLNIKRQPPAVFLSFYSIMESSDRSCDISVCAREWWLRTSEWHQTCEQNTTKIINSQLCLCVYQAIYFDG